MQSNIHYQLQPSDNIGSSERFNRPEWREMEQERRDRILDALFKANSRWPFANRPIMIYVMNVILQVTPDFNNLARMDDVELSTDENSRYWSRVQRLYMILLKLDNPTRLVLDRTDTLSISEALIRRSLEELNAFLILQDNPEEMFRRLKVESALLTAAMNLDQTLEEKRKARWQVMLKILKAKQAHGFKSEPRNEPSEKVQNAMSDALNELNALLEERFPSGSPFRRLYIPRDD